MKTSSFWCENNIKFGANVDFACENKKKLVRLSTYFIFLTGKYLFRWFAKLRETDDIVLFVVGKGLISTKNF